MTCPSPRCSPGRPRTHAEGAAPRARSPCPHTSPRHRSPCGDPGWSSMRRAIASTSSSWARSVAIPMLNSCLASPFTAAHVLTRNREPIIDLPHRRPQPLAREHRHTRAGAKITLVHHRISDRAQCNRATFFGVSLIPQFRGNGPRDALLDVVKTSSTIPFFGPEVGIRGHINQLRADPQAISGAPHTAFEEQ